MPKLTKTQSAILVSAAQREDGSALPLPDALKIKGAAVTRTRAEERQSDRRQPFLPWQPLPATV